MKWVLLCIAHILLRIVVFVYLNQLLVGKVDSLRDVGQVLKFVFVVDKAKRVASLVLVLQVDRYDSGVT